MVLQKRLDYGFNGFCSAAIPKATRSARRRSDRKRVEDNQMRAFDLLATVADKLLVETEKSPHRSSDTVVKRECSAQDMPFKTEPSYHDLNSSSKESELGLASVVTVSNNPETLVIEKSGNDTGSFASKVDDFSGYKESGDVILDSENKLMVKYEVHEEKIGLEDPVLGDQKPHALVGLENCSKVLLCADHIFESSYPVSGDDVKVVSRDDDENSFGCSHPMTSMRSFRTGSRIGDRRIRKILASKYWKAGPKYRDVMYSNNGGGDFRPFHRNRKNAYKRLRSQMNIPFKKRRLFYSDSVLKSDSIEKAVNTDASGTGTPSSFVGHHPSFQSRDSHVKLRIKSFRVPELFIEIPDTATVGSLKRSVMEAVTAILGGGLCVGVLVQGKKVKDDNKTLFQTGISHDNQLDSLGFTLEPPASNTTPPPLLHKESPRICPCDAPEPLTSYLPDPVVDDHPGNSDALSFPEPHLTRLGNVVENENHVSALVFPADMEVEKSTVDSKAIVAAPCMTVDPLSAVPVHQRCKRTEVQRRIRRPFSVAEVEALVEAAENFGTGRWRDIKLQAFDHAKHRTYVDLKDKWKTLVHTARISPQQRRGEPVPQELLDRVLAAHAYWSQQQAKQQFKHSQT